jgi:hypothetical protein
VDPAPDDKADKSPEHRLAVECIFILTMQEKLLFMEAVDKMGPLRATQRMFKAVVFDEEQEQADAAGA